MIFITLIILLTGVPTAVSQAIAKFDSGYLYFRTFGMESEEPECPRDNSTAIQIHTDGCEPEGTSQEYLLWNTTMEKLWEDINTEETSFLLQAGNEKLEYKECILTYTNSESSVEIPIYPEELWSILYEVKNDSATCTGQISIEASCPTLFEPTLIFVRPSTQLANLTERLLNRGKEQIQLEITLLE